jgi:hypothetical protein
VNFAEINLRFYVRRNDHERGVVFIREFVPRRAIAWMANVLYYESYRAAPLNSTSSEDDENITMTSTLTCSGRKHRLEATARTPLIVPPEESAEHFFKEHKWGYGIARDGGLLRYEVSHPVWSVYQNVRYTLAFDLGAVYGPEWAFLSGAKPASVVLARGSNVEVYPHNSG